MEEFKHLIKSKINFLAKIPIYVHYRSKHRFGLCSICGRKSIFFADKENIKESLHCIFCNAWFRLRFLSDQIINTFSKGTAISLTDLIREEDFGYLDIYEAQAQGPIHSVLKNCPNYICSEYFDNIKPSTIYNIRCEDLQKLSFRDNKFDIIIHTSVLEHVRKPISALREMYRVLKNEGSLIFEVPMTDPWRNSIRKKSIKRVDTSADEDVFILEPIYHGDAICKNGSLVHTDWGLDIVDTLKEIGFVVKTKTKSLEYSRMSHVVVFICKKPTYLPLPPTANSDGKSSE